MPENGCKQLWRNESSMSHDKKHEQPFCTESGFTHFLASDTLEAFLVLSGLHLGNEDLQLPFGFALREIRHVIVVGCNLD